MDVKRRDTLNIKKTMPKKRSKYLSLSYRNPVTVAFLVLVSIMATTFMIGLKFKADDWALDASDVGTISMHDYRAVRDFTYNKVDWDATLKARRDRVSQVFPIYDWENGMQFAISEKIRAAFEHMRSTAENQGNFEYLRQIPSMLVYPENAEAEKDSASDLSDNAISGLSGNADDANALSGSAESDAESSEKAVTAVTENAVSEDGATTASDEAQPETTSKLKKSVDERITIFMLNKKPEFVKIFGFEVNDDFYAWLVSERFSLKSENILVEGLNTVMSQRIVRSKESFDNLQQITVRKMDAGKTLDSYDLRNFADILSVREAEEILASYIRVNLPEAPEDFIEFGKKLIQVNFVYDEPATEFEKHVAETSSTELLIQQNFQKGQTVIASGHPITREHLAIYDAMRKSGASEQGIWQNHFSIALLLFLILVLIAIPFRKEIIGDDSKGGRDIVYFSVNIFSFAFFFKITTVFVTLVADAWFIKYPLIFIFPFAAWTMVIRLVISERISMLFILVALIVVGLIAQETAIVLPFALINLLAGSLAVDNPKSRSIVLKRGMIIGVVGAVMGVAILLYNGTVEMSIYQYFNVALIAWLGCLISSAVVTISLPLAESLFGYATGIKLLELSNLEHPALKALFLEAPGTYQHSMMVGSLNEAAAQAIGANAILARVGGYFHDIGKTKNSLYFAENQRDDNPHNRLKPNMSALILKAHVKDGIELAQKYNLPKDIVDFIATHHGTSRIEYFYQKAKEQNENVREEDYRYPGPKPQTRETGICMISDTIEAAVRSLPDKSPDRIRVLVSKLINSKFADGQFDECDLTLKDLNAIANSLLSILNAVYHKRPAYPGQQKKDAPKNAENKGESPSKKNENAPEKEEKTEILNPSPNHEPPPIKDIPLNVFKNS